MKKNALTTAILVAAFSVAAGANELNIEATWLWTHEHATPGQVSEIPAYDSKTNTIWVAGIVGVDVLDADTGTLVQHIDVTPFGFVNSVAIHNGLAALAIEAKSGPGTTGDRRTPGSVLFYDATTRSLTPGISQITVGSLPDMLTFSNSGRTLLVANEATPNSAADVAYTPPDPPGSVSIIDVGTRSVVATAGFVGVPTSGSNLRTPASTGMDFEPEAIAVDDVSKLAYVTLQEANAIGVLDLARNAFTQVIGLGAKDFNAAGNEIDPLNNGTVLFGLPPTPPAPTVKGLYMPDGVATYRYLGTPFLVMANEGDFREDNVDRAAAGGSPFNAPAPLNNLRISRPDSSASNLFAAGARSFSIRATNGALIWDSGSTLDREAHARDIYDDGRSRDKGVEPEGIALLELGFRTYAFVGLERTTKSAVAIFDISDPWNGRFLDMIMTDGDVAPEGLVVYHNRGRFYLVIANEVVAAGATTTHTTLYGLDLIWPHGED
jgi:hypothetical protein